MNGKSAGPVHQGAFYRFKYDISDLLNYNGKNLLEVTVSKESVNESINRAERLSDYWVFGGIFRPVYLEAVPQQFIDRVPMSPKADGSFCMDVYRRQRQGLNGWRPIRHPTGNLLVHQLLQFLIKIKPKPLSDSGNRHSGTPDFLKGTRWW